MHVTIVHNIFVVICRDFMLMKGEDHFGSIILVQLVVYLILWIISLSQLHKLIKQDVQLPSMKLLNISTTNLNK